eukprot:scaffold48544_cov63-Phaeocystis_antarctica.AAC.3
MLRLLQTLTILSAPSRCRCRGYSRSPQEHTAPPATAGVRSTAARIRRQVHMDVLGMDRDTGMDMGMDMLGMGMEKDIAVHMMMYQRGDECPEPYQRLPWRM